MTEAIVSGIIGLIGVFLGWKLNENTMKKATQPKLSLCMCNVPEHLTEEEPYRTKTSLTEYGIEIFNVGQCPFILDNFSLIHAGKTICDCFWTEEERVIQPYQSVKYILMKQEADELIRMCKEYDFEQCEVIAWGLDGAKVKTTLQVPLIKLRARFLREMGENIVRKQG